MAANTTLKSVNVTKLNSTNMLPVERERRFLILGSMGRFLKTKVAEAA